ncbi:hypothetical protein VTO42DRAFT_107 [Malbranchea cinnamomea]
MADLHGNKADKDNDVTNFARYIEVFTRLSGRNTLGPLFTPQLIRTKNGTVIAQGIFTEIVNFAGGMELLRQEIEISSSGLSPNTVNWISSA